MKIGQSNINRFFFTSLQFCIITLLNIVQTKRKYKKKKLKINLICLLFIFKCLKKKLLFHRSEKKAIFCCSSFIIALFSFHMLDVGCSCLQKKKYSVSVCKRELMRLCEGDKIQKTINGKVNLMKFFNKRSERACSIWFDSVKRTSVYQQNCKLTK